MRDSTYISRSVSTAPESRKFCDEPQAAVKQPERKREIADDERRDESRQQVRLLAPQLEVSASLKSGLRAATGIAGTGAGLVFDLDTDGKVT